MVTTNAGKSRVMGLEFEAIINPAPNHQFNFGVNLTSAEYVHFCPTGTRLIGRYSFTQFGTAPVQCFTPSHTNTQASATYNAPDKKWYLQAYVMNTENFIEVRAATADTVTPGDPRTYGVRAGFKF